MMSNFLDSRRFVNFVVHVILTVFGYNDSCGKGQYIIKKGTVPIQTIIS